MSEDTIWFIDKNKADCNQCNRPQCVRIEYYNAVRFPLSSNNEFITINLVKKKTLKICENCDHIEESWEEWNETRYPTSHETDFLRRRALYFKHFVPSVAQEGFLDFFKKKPSDYEMRYEYGNYLYTKGDIPEAYKELKISLNSKKNYLPAIQEITEVLYTLFISQNELWYEKRLYFGKFTKVFSNFSELKRELAFFLRYLIELYYNDHTILPKYCLWEGNLLEDSRKFAESIPYYDYARKASLHNWEKGEACIRLGMVYSCLQEYDKAIFMINESNSISPNVLNHFYKTKIYYKQRSNEKANQELATFLKEMDIRIEKDPQNAKLLYLKGLGLEYLESPQSMIEYYNWITTNLKIGIDFRKIFYAKVNNLMQSPTICSNEKSQFYCNVCESKKILIYKYPNQIVESYNWADGINTTIYYLQSQRFMCQQCNLEWWEYYNWDEREFEYPG